MIRRIAVMLAVALTLPSTALADACDDFKDKVTTEEKIFETLISTLKSGSNGKASVDALRAASKATSAERLQAEIELMRPLEGSDIAKGYLHNQWKGLVRFCDDGRYGIDTNPVENAIRPFCVGRRNWLFADTVAGANASARLYSLIECAKANGLEPYAYLRHVFTELPKAQYLAEVEALLPTRLDPAALARDSLQGSFPAARQ